MDEMAVDIEQAGAVIGFVNQMVVPDFVVQRGRLSDMVSALNRNLKSENAMRAAQGGARASGRERRRREPAEEAPGQPAAIVEHDATTVDWCGDLETFQPHSTWGI